MEEVTSQLHARPLVEQGIPARKEIHLVVNGIMNPHPDDVKGSAQHLQQQFGLLPDLVWYFHICDDLNRVSPLPRDQNIFRSLLECGGHSLFGTATPGPDRLKTDIQTFLSRGNTVRIHSHSRGALITQLALDGLSLAERQNVWVRTYGGITLIPQGMAGKGVENVINLSDIATQCGQLCLMASFGDIPQIEATSFASQWVAHVCHSRSAAEALARSALSPSQPAVADMPDIAQILSTVTVQRWTNGLPSHDFVSYITHAARPDPSDVAADTKFRQARDMGVRQWVPYMIAWAVVQMRGSTPDQS